MKTFIKLLIIVFTRSIYAQDLPPYYKNMTIQTAIVAENIRGTTFDPDGKAVYFAGNLSGDNRRPILVSYYKNNSWALPDTIMSTKDLKCTDPFMSPDGSKLFIAVTVSDVHHIYVIGKNNESWSNPTKLNNSINLSDQVFPTLTENGTLYFTRGFGDIYYSKPVDGEYTEPVKLPAAINTSSAEWDACIAKDESFIVFCSNRAGSKGYSDLYISYNKNGEWTPAINLGPSVNSNSNEGLPGISPEGKYLFFTSDRSGSNLVYQIDVSSLPQSSVTEITNKKNAITFSCSPNPFYSSVTFNFNLNRPALVNLRIFNQQGELIENIINQDLNSGEHKFTWNPKGLPAGIYYCQFKTNYFAETKKLILLK